MRTQTGALLVLLSLLAACSEAPPPAAPAKPARPLVVGAGDAATDGTQRGYSGQVRARIVAQPGGQEGGGAGKLHVRLRI